MFVPSYFDYVRLRNFMQAENVDFAGLSEYATPSELGRGRSLFADGRARVALLTERCHFYNRMRLRNVQVRLTCGDSACISLSLHLCGDKQCLP